MKNINRHIFSWIIMHPICRQLRKKISFKSALETFASLSGHLRTALSFVAVVSPFHNSVNFFYQFPFLLKIFTNFSEYFTWFFVIIGCKPVIWTPLKLRRKIISSSTSPYTWSHKKNYIVLFTNWNLDNLGSLILMSISVTLQISTRSTSAVVYL